MTRRLLPIVASLVWILACQAPLPSGQPSLVSGSNSGAAVPHIAELANGEVADLTGCEDEPSAGVLYLASPGRAGTARLSALDPDSLANLAECARLGPRPVEWSRRSDDGSLIASIRIDQGPGDPRANLSQGPSGPPFFTATVVVQEGLSGEERSRFQPPGPLGGGLRFSADGALLLVQGWHASSRAESVDWYVADAASGKLKATIPIEPGASSRVFFGESPRRLYRLISRASGFDPGASAPPATPSEPGPWPMELVAYDLDAGAQVVGRLALPRVRGGSWWSDRNVNGQRIPVQVLPGAALSPDKRRLALPHTADDGVTLVDLDRLAVERTIGAARAPTLLDRLGLSATSAHAKGMDGTIGLARFAPSGDLLYVWGTEMKMEENGLMRETALPLRVLDLSRGNLVAEAGQDVSPAEVAISLDGGAVYVGGYRRGTGSGPSSTPTYTLRRLDPRSLDIRAERNMAGFHWLQLGSSPLRIDPGELG